MIDVELFGGRGEFVRHLVVRAKNSFGAYSHLTSIEWRSIDRLVFICKGNICRSPYAAVKARSMGIDAVSCGLEAIDGASANPDAMRNAAPRQQDLSSHSSLKLRASEIRANDLVLFFEPRHIVEYRKVCVSHPASISLLGLWAEPQRPYVSDPYGKSDRYFQACFAVIDSGLQAVSGRLLKKT